ncbi:VanZ family protein [Herbiconiux daphne]|uniref:VanZ family protein n=1 Tax=Herbiconiux daphne TaxID=2970914 RepID=A0ABT2H3C2_9MICO|nr:VanZ family protein [Herbiconiux daphne]MCS5734420.1 VanZ family protein [Herbiconiux daphne]
MAKPQPASWGACQADATMLTLALNAAFAALLAALALVGVICAFEPSPAHRGRIAALALIWLAAVLFMTLRPGTGLGVRLYLTPLVVDGPGSAVDAVLNVFVFVPLGLLLALAAVRFRTVLLGALALSLIIEVTQYVSDVGRTADINDIITNVTGACFGWALATAIHLLARRAAARRGLREPERVASVIRL